jgi:hypothetical protein
MINSEIFMQKLNYYLIFQINLEFYQIYKSITQIEYICK